LIFHEPIIGSDHAPLRLDLHNNNNHKTPPFRYDTRWLSNQNCDRIINEIWRSEESIEEKLLRGNKEISNWAKKNRYDRNKREQQLKDRIQIIQTIPRTGTTAAEERILKTELEDIWNHNSLLWKQTAKQHWVNEGDRNTAFFHATTVHRRQRNHITRLKNQEEEWTSTPTELENLTKSFFVDLFTARQQVDSSLILPLLPKLVSDEINYNLTRPVSDEEIRTAVFALGAAQSPGPDGYNGHFYRKYWSLIGNQIGGEIKKFFADSIMPVGWNDTNIVLIPKTNLPTKITEFRPISCCNFRYKIITKIMSSRLKTWLPNMIAENQAAFTADRCIQDNIIIVHEVLHHFKIRKKGRKKDMCIKLDMRKAYDLVDWDSLHQILKAYGFSEMWCKWIYSCISTVKFDILLNGRSTGFFSPTRGIRQGDPISPFLFILMSNALTTLIDSAISRKITNGIKLTSRGPLLSHCLFADDTIIFGKDTVEEATRIIQIINSYGEITGQQVNNDKSAIYFSSNVSVSEKAAIMDSIGFQALNANPTYLGVPTEWGRSKKETFSFLLDRMYNKAQSWKSQMLSHAGKEVLLKSIIQAIPSYIMSLFALSKGLIKKMNSILRQFFWSGSLTKRAIHWTNGDVLCTPKSDGGLGFRDFYHFNMALLAKQAWRLMTNQDALWARLLKSLYFRNSDFMTAKKHARPSWIWASILKSKYILAEGAFKEMGDGETISL
ncbi:LINE-1 reverse transcriptase homolog, partial [Linum perenne]